ncbi:hypothetical protein NC653_003889 [Populus alba x Populus x berolinensis]|uniref:Uncharacterized protein n=1 Tax=Populus alba x Populus x berolinensis TaxID=444605 RepID=A0AAD6RTH1_9ROSI|nr:hypothetical protein NC653_003889 [Populus alba x Populus x berolinensis]
MQNVSFSKQGLLTQSSSCWIPKTPVSASQRCHRFSLISLAYFVVFCVEGHGLTVQSKKVVQAELLVSVFASEGIYNGMMLFRSAQTASHCPFLLLFSCKY